jgi:hypothetical protein
MVVNFKLNILIISAMVKDQIQPLVLVKITDVVLVWVLPMVKDLRVTY